MRVGVSACRRVGVSACRRGRLVGEICLLSWGGGRQGADELLIA
jgi:hypothetical protein